APHSWRRKWRPRPSGGRRLRSAVCPSSPHIPSSPRPSSHCAGVKVCSCRAWISLPIRRPRVAYTAWCWRTFILPSKVALTTMPRKCTPSSPSMKTNSQGRPCSIRRLISLASNIWNPLRTQLVAPREHRQGERREYHETQAHHAERKPGRGVRLTEETVAEPVDHEEERVEMRHVLPELRQRVDRVEHARQHRERHDQEVLE